METTVDFRERKLQALIMAQKWSAKQTMVMLTDEHWAELATNINNIENFEKMIMLNTSVRDICVTGNTVEYINKGDKVNKDQFVFSSEEFFTDPYFIEDLRNEISKKVPNSWISVFQHTICRGIFMIQIGGKKEY